MRTLEEVFGQVVPGASSPRDLWRDPARMEHVEEALRNAAASAQLAAARVEVSRLEGLFSDASGKIGKLARDLLGEAIGRSDIETETIARLWGALRRQIDDLNQHKNHLALVRTVTRPDPRSGGSSLEPASGHRTSRRRNGYLDPRRLA